LISDVVNVVQQGGWVMLPLALVCLAAWAIIAYDWLALRACTHRDGYAVDLAVERLQRGESPGIDDNSPTSGSVVLAVLRSGITATELDRDSFEARVGPLLRSEAVMRQRSLGIVAMLASAMPLLGLLGTVIGMTHTFSAFTATGAPQVDTLAGGISQALITTEAGLVAAVPVLLMHGVLSSRVRRYLDSAEITLKKIETLVCRDA
jgi:biopolymer transport protein ExbB